MFTPEAAAADFLEAVLFWGFKQTMITISDMADIWCKIHEKGKK